MIIMTTSNYSNCIECPLFVQLNHYFPFSDFLYLQEKQGRKRPLDTPKKIIERREREGEREKER